MEPLGVQRRYVPHFKDLISGNLDFEAQGRDSTFTFLHALLKKTILLHKRAYRFVTFALLCILTLDFASFLHRRAKVTDRLPFLGVKWLF